MSERKKREYQAIIWTKDPTQPGTRVTTWAVDLEEARRQLEEEYGEGTVFYLHNEEDANKVR
jgi:hypothetical protein